MKQKSQKYIRFTKVDYGNSVRYINEFLNEYGSVGLFTHDFDVETNFGSEKRESFAYVGSKYKDDLIISLLHHIFKNNFNSVFKFEEIMEEYGIPVEHFVR